MALATITTTIAAAAGAAGWAMGKRSAWVPDDLTPVQARECSRMMTIPEFRDLAPSLEMRFLGLPASCLQLFERGHSIWLSPKIYVTARTKEYWQFTMSARAIDTPSYHAKIEFTVGKVTAVVDLNPQVKNYRKRNEAKP
jgi:hypothetical protein